MSWVQDWQAKAAAAKEAASYGSNVAKQISSASDYQARIDQLQAQLDALPAGNGGLYSGLRRATLLGQIENLKKQQLQTDPNYGITSPAQPAPLLGPRHTSAPVGIDALKILLPTT